MTEEVREYCITNNVPYDAACSWEGEERLNDFAEFCIEESGFSMLAIYSIYISELVEMDLEELVSITDFSDYSEDDARIDIANHFANKYGS